MSIIKRLKLEGFKSFAKPTILHFENGFNTIVGANGSGKSNVFDALCFVLGRMSSKGLRAEKLGNLVFNGGKGMKPAKEAEVALFLSNDNKELLNVELDEIKISRVVKRDGQSTYYLNNNKVTRTEIVEILKRAHIDPDGYNIILQGDIMRIVNMTPIERRELIEEISDISGYEEKREKALKKLEKIETDLKEADLLMEEKTKYLRELKSEKEQAEKFHKTKEDLRFQSLLLLKAKLKRNADLRIKKEDELKENEEKLGEYKDKLDEFEAQTKKIDEEIHSLEKQIEIKSHGDFIEVTNKITQQETKLQGLNERKAELKKQIEEMKSKEVGVNENIAKNNKQIKEIESETKDIRDRKTALEKELKELDSKLQDKKKGLSTSSFKELDDLDAQIDELNKKKLDKNHLREDNAIQVEKLNTKLEHLEEEQKRLEGSAAENKDSVNELEKLRKELKELILKISQTANNNSETSAKLSNLIQESNELNEKFSRLQIKAAQSKDLMASNRAVDTILKLKATDKGIHGTVAELASVPSKYSSALETVAGKSLFNIVVDNDQTAVKYIRYLKDKKIGNATFLPLNKINAKFKLDESVMSKKGAVDYALNIVRYDKQYENIFNLVFQDTLVIEDINDAKGIGIGSYKMVTLDGDYVAKTGAMSGGFKSRSKGLGAFKDDESSKELEKVSSKLESLNSTISHLKSEKEDSETKLYELRQRKLEVEGDISKIEKILSIGGRDFNSLKGEIEAIIGDKTIVEGSLKKIERDIKMLDEELEKIYKRKVEIKGVSSGTGSVMEEVSKLEEKRDKVRENLVEVSSKLDSKQIHITSVLTPEIKNLEKILKETRESSEKTKTNFEKLTSEIKDIESEIKELKVKEKELSKDYKDFIAKRDKFKEEKIKLEQKYEKEFSRFDSIKEKSAQLRYAISEFETLSKTLNEELEVLYNEIKTELVDMVEDKTKGEDEIKDLVDSVDSRLKGSPIDVKELQNRVNNLKSRLTAFGSINMKAVEIYDKLNEEFTALLEKRETLNSEKKEILEFIAEMDEKKKERFMETFVQLREQFVKTYSELSTKGEAELEIENENDLFNSGVDIRVRLSQKNYLDIKSLSGGEKTITAVSFIFAVQEFHPASFYIFDEIDAALDIMNCEKLGKLIAKNAHKAQYVVVSHSEYLIQSAQSIYGVTMDATKVSGVVSLDLKDTKDYVDDAPAET